MGEIPDAAASVNVEEAGLGRIEVARVWLAISKLNPKQQMALLDGLMPEPAKPQPARASVKMMRMRARRQLVTMLETASALVILLRTRVHQLVAEPGQAAVAAFATGAVLVAAAGGTGGFGVQGPQTRDRSTVASPSHQGNSTARALARAAARRSQGGSAATSTFVLAAASETVTVPAATQPSEPENDVDADAGITAGPDGPKSGTDLSLGPAEVHVTQDATATQVCTNVKTGRGATSACVGGGN